MLHVYLLGGLTLTWQDEPLPAIPSRAARSLCAYLVTYRDRSHTRDLLAGTFWPNLPDAAARRRLSQALWLIRNILRHRQESGTLQVQDEALEPHPILLTESDTVQLNPDLPLWLDVKEFGRLVDWGIGRLGDQSQAQTTNLPIYQPTNIPQLGEVVELYQGDFLAGYYDDWILTERERLREVFLGALGQLVKGCKGRGEYEQALLYARRLASEDPWREESHCEVMRLYHLLERDTEALKQFETCRRVLAEELAVEPSSETVALAREIATRSSDVAPPVLPEFSPAPVALLLEDPEAPALPLVGREAERTALLAHVDALFQGLGGVVLVEGEAGVGKSRLLRSVAGDAEWRGVEVLWAGGQESGATTPYGPLLAALNEGLSPLRAGQLAQLVEGIWLRALATLLPPPSPPRCPICPRRPNWSRPRSGIDCRRRPRRQVYSDSADEGETYHGQCVVDTVTGQWSYSGAISGPNVTALASDADGNTSEFSAPYSLGGSSGVCANPLTISCGQTVSGDTSGYNNIGGYSCSGWDESGPEVIYRFTLASASDVKAEIMNLAVDLDVFLLAAGGCDAGQCLTAGSYGDTEATASNVSPGTYYIAVDGYAGAAGAFDLRLTCGQYQVFLPLVRR